MSSNGISEFSVRFSRALQGVMREHGVRIDDVASASGRSRGFVSEHTSGKAAPDTDLLDAVAEIIEVGTPALVAEIVRRMEPPEGRSASTASTDGPDSGGDELAARRGPKRPTFPAPVKKSARKDPPKGQG